MRSRRARARPRRAPVDRFAIGAGRAERCSRRSQPRRPCWSSSTTRIGSTPRRRTPCASRHGGCAATAVGDADRHAPGLALRRCRRRACRSCPGRRASIRASCSSAAHSTEHGPLRGLGRRAARRAQRPATRWRSSRSPRGLSAAQRAGDAADRGPDAGRVAARRRAAPAGRAARRTDTRRALLVAAAERRIERMQPVAGALRVLGLDPAALGLAEEAGVILAVDGLRFEFRHPLLRSADLPRRVRAAAPSRARGARALQPRVRRVPGTSPTRRSTRMKPSPKRSRRRREARAAWAPAAAAAACERAARHVPVRRRADAGDWSRPPTTPTTRAGWPPR